MDGIISDYKGCYITGRYAEDGSLLEQIGAETTELENDNMDADMCKLWCIYLVGIIIFPLAYVMLLLYVVLCIIIIIKLIHNLYMHVKVNSENSVKS